MRSDLALSIRQPWAWLILHGGKDVENRRWPTRQRGRVYIHAAKGMTPQEYENVRDDYLRFEIEPFTKRSIQLPAFAELERGGIVGEVEIVQCVDCSSSPWFEGPYGFVLCDPRPLPFRPCKGMLGFFEIPPRARSPIR